MFKSCLFLVVGGGLHFAFGGQDWRGYSSLIFFSKRQAVVLFLCCMCLCGLFFTSGFVSKDTALDFFVSKQVSFLFLVFFVAGLFLTFLYCFRLF